MSIQYIVMDIVCVYWVWLDKHIKNNKEEERIIKNIKKKTFRRRRTGGSLVATAGSLTYSLLWE